MFVAFHVLHARVTSVGACCVQPHRDGAGSAAVSDDSRRGRERRCHLTTVRLLAPHLTSANHVDVLERARHKSKRDVELLAATLSPKPDVPCVVRKLPTPALSPKARFTEVAVPVPVAAEEEPSRPTEPARSAPQKPAVMKPLAPGRYKIEVTVSREVYDKLRRAQDLLRHRVPNGDPAIILERALDLLVAELERAKVAMTAKPRAARETKPGSRHIPAVVRRIVWNRDGGRCAFRGTQGRCAETGFLEFHHAVPYADGGTTSASNLELRCRAHNQHEADLWFGSAQTPGVREDRPGFGRSPARSRTSSWTPQIN